MSKIIYSIPGYSNKDKLREALKQFNARPNIDRESSLDNEVETVPGRFSDNSDPELEQLALVSTPATNIKTEVNLSTSTAAASTSTTTTTTKKSLPVVFTTTTSTTTESFSSTTTPASPTPKLIVDKFLPQEDKHEDDEDTVVESDRTNDNFLFGPQPRPIPSTTSTNTVRKSLVFTTANPNSAVDQSINDIVLGTANNFSSYLNNAGIC